MLLSDFDYHLPDDLIAQHPARNRRDARMMVVNRDSGDIELGMFADFPDYINPGDCLVVNDTRVLRARLLGTKIGTGGRVEALLTHEISPGDWNALLKPCKRLKPGTVVTISDSGGNTDMAASFTVISTQADGSGIIRFSNPDVKRLLDSAGHVPLPPYIRRGDSPADTDRYQTVYSTNPGAIAAPTAGLHFDRATLDRLAARRIAFAPLTLHVGVGTFRKIETEHIEDHKMHREHYTLPVKSAELINNTLDAGGAIVAVGTTTVRVLETCANPDGSVAPSTGLTDIFLHPPYRPKVPHKLLTNFHLPRSSLLLMLCCFTSRPAVLNAYTTAVRERFRFYSYGDCMLLNRNP